MVPPVDAAAGRGRVATARWRAWSAACARAHHECVIIADDDVRYRPEQLAEMVERLAGWDLVPPQNVFVTPGGTLPWHARWDTARILINRAVGGDYPGTFGLRRTAFLATGGYDGDVLFENLQMMRTMRAAGARIARAEGMFVARIPPTARQFWHQRIRQAYDDFGQPGRLVIEASWLPLALSAARRALPRRADAPRHPSGRAGPWSGPRGAHGVNGARHAAGTRRPEYCAASLRSP